ncbi:glycosyltransferase family 2 protein [Ramlibacter montanisoli]|uniref:glycosyltransferase family 2 protein n=1 Tax=Ramlibacter montanisoli TaxID=2732512 RepID=UPI00209C1F4D|nr:glycosyltransferase family 2 protein [Ramlibacter montanisoli]
MERRERKGDARIMENHRMSRPTLSVVIAARNEAHQIAECVRSVSFADEVIVLDSSSTDATEAVAREAGAKVHVTDWPGYGRQQQRGIGLATSDWVMSLDADERVSEELAREVRAAIENPVADGYRLPGIRASAANSSTTADGARTTPCGWCGASAPASPTTSCMRT